MMQISQEEWNAAFGELVRPISVLHQIAGEITKKTGVTQDQLRGRCRKRITTAARHLFMFKAHQAGASYSQIGEFLARDHTSVMHGAKKIQRQMEKKNA